MKPNRKGSIPAPEFDFGESRLIRFYRGTEKDPAGRMIEDTWRMNEEELEERHDYIQWLFPLPQRSRYNPKAPVLSQTDINTFKQDAGLKGRVLRSYRLMLSFYGFNLQPSDGSFAVVLSGNFTNRIAVWLYPRSHNYLRISRILNFLMLIGLHKEAQAFFDALQELNLAHHKKIGSAFSYWRAAMN